MTLLSTDERVALTGAVFRLLDAWQVSSKGQPALLGLDPNLNPKKMNRYRLGMPLPDDAGVYARIALLLKIEHALQKLFPHSQLSANLWVTTRRVKLGNATPLEMMINKGIEGIKSVERGLYNLDVW